MQLGMLVNSMAADTPSVYGDTAGKYQAIHLVLDGRSRDMCGAVDIDFAKRRGIERIGRSQSGEMVDLCNPLRRLGERSVVAHVALENPHLRVIVPGPGVARKHECAYPTTFVAQDPDQISTDKTGGAGDENFHVSTQLVIIEAIR